MARAVAVAVTASAPQDAFVVYSDGQTELDGAFDTGAEPGGGTTTIAPRHAVGGGCCFCHAARPTVAPIAVSTPTTIHR